jgi:hypothetical protein
MTKFITFLFVIVFLAGTMLLNYFALTGQLWQAFVGVIILSLFLTGILYLLLVQPKKEK